MKTLENIKDAYIAGNIFIDMNRRISKFIPDNKLKDFGIEMQEHTLVDFNKANIIEELKKDVEFGFESALMQNSVLAIYMFDVVKMWNWILEDGLEGYVNDNCTEYGVSLFTKNAIKYKIELPPHIMMSRLTRCIN